MQQAMKLNFFERFLYCIQMIFHNGFFPGFCDGWDLSEHMLPTLAKHWGGEVQQFAQDGAKELNAFRQKATSRSIL